jgi:hypothetical protein
MNEEFLATLSKSQLSNYFSVEVLECLISEPTQSKIDEVEKILIEFHRLMLLQSSLSCKKIRQKN